MKMFLLIEIAFCGGREEGSCNEYRFSGFEIATMGGLNGFYWSSVEILFKFYK